MRQFLGAIVGVLIGVAGGMMFMQSMPPPEGSVTERAEHAEHELRRAERAIRELRAEGRRAGPGSGTIGRRNIVADVRAGKNVDVDDLFQVTKEYLRNISPIMNRMQVWEQKKMFSELAGELGRNYDLTDQQQESLKRWFDARAVENADRMQEIIDSDQSRLEDFVRAGMEAEENLRGLDQVMEGMLSGEPLDRFREDRMNDRMDSVEEEANGRVNRLDHLVNLEAQQEDELFYLLARSSQEYDSAMEMEGWTGNRSAIQREERNDAIREALRPDQRALFDAHRAEQREDAERDLKEVGLRLPDDWDLFDDYDW